MYDDLVKNLRYCADATTCEGCFWRSGCCLTDMKRNAADAIEELQADVCSVVRGAWGYRWKIHGDGRRPTELFPCSVCGFENTSATNYCPNCGADMRKGS